MDSLMADILGMLIVTAIIAGFMYWGFKDD